MAGIRINSNNFNGKSVEITFNPFSGGTIDLGTQTIPYDYLSSNYEGDYSIYIPEYDKTCDLIVGVAPSPTPTSTPTPTSSSTPTPTPTSSSTPTLTPTPSTPSIDPDAAAYLADVVASGGTTNPTIEAAVDTLFTDLKSNGLYSKMLAMYPYVGATAASHSINALLNKTYDITWYGGMSHSISGATGDGINGYGDTNFLSVNFTANDNYSFGLYQNTENTPAKTEEISMGTFFGTTYFQLATNVNSVNWFMRSNSSTGTQGANSGNIDGNYIVNRTGTTYTSLSRNATTILSNTSSPASLQGTNKIFLFNMGYSSPPQVPYGNGYANQTFGFTFMGEGLSNSEITTLDSIINTFQTSLGRNTYFSVSDPDAQAYIDDVVASGGTIDQTIADATNTLFTDLKSNGLYSKMLAMYPYVGSTAASHSINALLNKTYDITWNGGMTHGISGSTGNGTNGYGNTNFGNDIWAQDDISFGIYQVSENVSTQTIECSFGSVTSGSLPQIQISTNLTQGQPIGATYFRIGSTTQVNNTNGGNYNGNYIATRTGSTEGYLYRNTNLILTNSTTYTKGGSITDNYVFNVNVSNAPLINGYANQTYGFTFMGEGLSNSEITILDSIINTFQTSLGRNTY